MTSKNRHLDREISIIMKTSGIKIPLPEINESILVNIVKDINDVGFGMISNYISPTQLRQMQKFVSSKVVIGKDYVGLSGKDAVAGSVFSNLSDTPAFYDLMQRIYERGTGKKAPDVELYQFLRCLTGQSGNAHSLNFHFDSYVVTALIPVEIPPTGQAGDFVILPNMRGIRNTYIFNMIDKILLNNDISQYILRFIHKRNWLPVMRIKMIPGNIYLFWGYRSIHANEACDPSQLRATAIYHFMNPHALSSLRNIYKRLMR